jgi:hypothetical protein
MYYQTSIFDEKFSNLAIAPENIKAPESSNSGVKLKTILLLVSIAVVVGGIIYYYRKQQFIKTRDKSDVNVQSTPEFY